MEFTNEEVINFLVNPLKKYSQLDIRLLSKDDTIIPLKHRQNSFSACNS